MEGADIRVIATVVTGLLLIGACSQATDADRAGQALSSVAGRSDSTPTRNATGPGDAGLAPGLIWLLRGDERGLEGWTHNGSGTFVRTADGVRSRGGIGLLWYSAHAFRDFVLRLQWRVASPDDNSGVFVRFPPPADPAVAVPGGLEIQIYDGAAGEPQKTGAIYDVQPARRRNSNAPGTWNDYTICVVGSQVTVVLNGVVVNTYEAAEGALPASGHVGLQNHGPRDDVTFRRVRIRELDPSAASIPPSLVDGCVW